MLLRSSLTCRSSSVTSSLETREISSTTRCCIALHVLFSSFTVWHSNRLINRLINKSIGRDRNKGRCVEGDSCQDGRTHKQTHSHVHMSSYDSNFDRNIKYHTAEVWQIWLRASSKLGILTVQKIHRIWIFTSQSVSSRSEIFAQLCKNSVSAFSVTAGKRKGTTWQLQLAQDAYLRARSLQSTQIPEWIWH